ncbi:MAG: PAS domain-containing protein [Gloeomargarita sp. SKYBB_i_bin120]|nr:PAS domain-containing protein [Gloeomargarita sp. SKYG98]MCS7291433.1 PAS domain-containing protein [Gloeomargarita sp. SKYB120]MDW8176993.1 PAS domain-containing protein [Gloeomargarita sp. SKYBB_i_bin120]
MEFSLLLQQATLQVQESVPVLGILQSLLTTWQRGSGAKGIGLYREQQPVLRVGELTLFHPLPCTWQAQKVTRDTGETWFLPVRVRQQGAAWLVVNWEICPSETLYQQGEVLAAHIGLIIQATNWEHLQPELQDQPYYFLLDSLPIGVGLANAQGECIYVNNAILRMFQAPKQDLLGQGWSAFIHPDDRQRVLETWREILQSPSDFELEYRVRRPSGDVIWVHSYLAVLRNDSGQVVGFLGAVTDITQAKVLEQMLTQSEKRYRNLVEYQTDFLLYSLADTTITFANPALCDALGYTFDEMVGMKWDDLVLQKQDLQVLKGNVQRLSQEESIFHYANYIRGKQGQTLLVEFLNLGIFDEHGQLLAIQSLGRDITELRRAEQELRDSRDFLATLIQNIPGIVYRFHPATPERPAYLSYINGYAEEIFELPASQIMADPCAVWEQYTHPDDLERLTTSVQSAVEQKAPWHCEWRMITPSGKLKWLQGRSQVRQQGDEWFWDGLILDVTQSKLAELELERNRAFLERVIDATKAIIYVYDLENQRNIFVNPEIEQVLGYSPAEIQAMGSELFNRLVHPEDMPVIEANISRLLHPQTTGEVMGEYRMRTKSGEYRWLLSHDRIFKCNEQGQPQHILGVAVDITELKNVQQALAENQRLLQQILDNLPVTVWRYQRWPDGRETFLYVSPGCQELFGITAEQMLQNPQTLWQLIVPQDIPVAHASLEHSLEHLMTCRCEFRIITPYGECKWIRGCGQPERQPDGSTIWDAVFVDITAQKEAEFQLRDFNQQLEQRVRERTIQLQQQAQTEGLLRIIIETIHQSLDIEKTLNVVLEETRRTLACDRILVYKFNDDWSGYFLAESVAAGWDPVITGPQTPLADHCLQETEGGRFRHHYILVSNDIYNSGFSECHIRLLEQFQARAQVVVPIFLNQKLWGLLAAYQNSGPRAWQTHEIEMLQHVGLHLAIALRQSELYKAAQAQVVELQKLNQLKDEFLSTVSHELRSPMHNIGLALKMLELRLARAGILHDENLGIGRYLDVLKTSTQRETDLINDLLDLARLNADPSDLPTELVDVPKLLDELLPPLRERMAAQQQTFILEIPETFRYLETHAASLARILQELLHNACKYTPPQETITLAIQRLGDQCDFRVINTGVEIPPEEQQRVFDTFYRIPSHDPWQYGGTGLGLALVKKLVERLHGEIHLFSAHKKTEFRVRLPVGETGNGGGATG